METFNIISFDTKEIVLSSSDQIHKFYQAVHSDAEVLLTWKEGGIQKSEVVITSMIIEKIKAGEVKIRSEERVS